MILQVPLPLFAFVHSINCLKGGASAHHQLLRRALRSHQRSGLRSPVLLLRSSCRQAVFHELVLDTRLIRLHISAHDDNQVILLPLAQNCLPHLTSCNSECYKRRDTALQATFLTRVEASLRSDAHSASLCSYWRSCDHAAFLFFLATWMQVLTLECPKPTNYRPTPDWFFRLAARLEKHGAEFSVTSRHKLAARACTMGSA